MSKPLLVSFSGGRTSALMARMIQTSPIWEGREKHYVYANTGREREETLRFVHECDTRWNLGVAWVEAVVTPEKGKGTRHRITSYSAAIRNTDESTAEGHPFVAMVSKYGLPTNAFPHCTRELKDRPITSYMRSLAVRKYETAVGIRADEAHRASPRPGFIYPLIALGITEPIVRSFWARQDFDLELKDYQGNCDLCFKKSLRKRLTILRETPEIAAFWSALEGRRTNPRGIPVDLVFDREGLSVPKLVEVSKDPALTLALDRNDTRLPGLFDRMDFDFEKPCHCASS